MARSRTRGRKTTSRKTSASSRRPAGATGEAEVVEEEDNVGGEGGMAIMTAIILVAACLFLDYHLGTTYEAGVFF